MLNLLFFNYYIYVLCNQAFIHRLNNEIEEEPVPSNPASHNGINFIAFKKLRAIYLKIVLDINVNEIACVGIVELSVFILCTCNNR